jgi:starvation-inducible DNA-binding protein
MSVHSTLSEQHAKTTGEALQGALVDLVDLSLLAKQAHWNVVGKNFRSVHLQLDEVVAAARQYTDTVAERAVAIGLTPDGRASTVSRESQVEPLDAGYIAAETVVDAFATRLNAIIGRMRERMNATEEADPVTQDLFIDIVADLEKLSWMFQAAR